MNKLIGVGRLTKDPEVRYANSGNNTCIARFGIAINRKFHREGEPDADFFNCIAFGKQGEFAEKYLKKGMKIVFSGQVQNNNYTDNNGNKVYSTQILVEEMEFAESKGTSNAEPVNKADDGFMKIGMDIEEEELPFA